MMFAPEKGIDPEKNPMIRLFRRFVPVTPELHGQRFFVRLNGRAHATPLFMALLFVEVTDIIFAVDSVPAIYALTDEPLIVFSSNVFAILGLRAMYFHAGRRCGAGSPAQVRAAVVLIFVGLKMVWLNDLVRRKVPDHLLARHHRRGHRRLRPRVAAFPEGPRVGGDPAGPGVH